MTEFQLYKSNNNLTITIQLAIIVGTFSVIFFIFPSVDKITVTTILFILIAYISLSDKKDSTIGIMLIDSHRIGFNVNKNNFQFEISEIEKLELLYSGYEGKKVAGDIIPIFNKFSGLDNYIKIQKDNRVYKYNFFVENKIQESKLFELIIVWNNLGYDIGNIKINK